MIDALTEPFGQGIAQRALLEVVVLGAACGPLGTWVLLYRQSYAAESIAHAMLPGLVIAALAGVPLALGAAGGVLVAAAGVALAARGHRVGADAGVAVTITALFGAGVLLALTPAAPARLGELLFGDLLGVTLTDLVIAAGLVLVVALALAVAHRPLALAAFDPAAAPGLGARPGRVELALLALLGLTVVAAVQALGNLLVVALLIAPAAAAQRLVGRLWPALLLSALLAALAGAGGLYLSHYLDLAAGASVALVAVLEFAATLPLGARVSGARAIGGSPIEGLGRAR